VCPPIGLQVESLNFNHANLFDPFRQQVDLRTNQIGNLESWIDVKYFPIDEDHPGQATDVYAFSIQLLEQIEAYFWQRDEITSACLRFPFIYNPRQSSPDRKDQYLQSNRDSYAQLMDLPKEERVIHTRKLLDMHLQLRHQNIHGEISFPEMMQTLISLPGGMLMFGHADFWSLLYVNDAAISIERAIVADYEGYQPFYITAPNNVLGLPSRQLAELFYPEVTTWKRDIQGSQTRLNCEKVKIILGFEANFD